jgi:hypothetical protein
MSEYSDLDIKCDGMLEVIETQNTELQSQFKMWMDLKGVSLGKSTINSKITSNILKTIFDNINDHGKQTPAKGVCFDRGGHDKTGGGYDKSSFDRACFDRS